MTTISERLREFNRWRRGTDETQPMPNPADIGELIDCAADRLDVLERESVEHFEKWHAERRKREALELEVARLKEDVSKAVKHAYAKAQRDTAALCAYLCEDMPGGEAIAKKINGIGKRGSK